MLGAVRPLLILIPGIVLMSTYAILSRSFTARGRQEVTIAAIMAALAISVMLIPHYGIIGAAAAHTASRGAAALWLIAGHVRESGTSLRDVLLVSPAEAAALLRPRRPPEDAPPAP